MIVDKCLLPINQAWQRLEAVSLRKTLAGGMEDTCMLVVSFVDHFLIGDVGAFAGNIEPTRYKPLDESEMDV